MNNKLIHKKKLENNSIIFLIERKKFKTFFLVGNGSNAGSGSGFRSKLYGFTILTRSINLVTIDDSLSDLQLIFVSVDSRVRPLTITHQDVPKAVGTI